MFQRYLQISQILYILSIAIVDKMKSLDILNVAFEFHELAIISSQSSQVLYIADQSDIAASAASCANVQLFHRNCRRPQVCSSSSSLKSRNHSTSVR